MSDVMARDGDEAGATPEGQTGSAARPDSLPCPICETVLTGVQYGPDAPRVKCPSCGGVERHRAFAQAYREKFEGLEGLTGRRVLAVRPDWADRIMLRNFGAAEVVIFDAMPRDNPDVIGDPTAMDFEDDSFDVVFSNGFLATMRRPDAVIAEMRRVLKPDGLALIYEGASIGGKTTPVDDPARQIAWYGQDNLDKHDVGHFRTWGFADLQDHLDEAFGTGVFQTADPVTDKVFNWLVGANQPLVGGGLFLEAWEVERLRGAAAQPDPASLRGEPPYTCTLCDQQFDAVVGKDRCPHCNSNARTRTVPEIAREHLAHLADPEVAARLPLLAFALVRNERRFLEPIFPTFQKASLYGAYGEDNIEGVDARDLSRFADDSFSGTFSVGMYDFFAEHEDALAHAFRVTAPGGAFIHLILPARLRPGMQPPLVEFTVQKHGAYYDYMPDGTEMASITVGREWFLDAMGRAGFEARIETAFDPATGETFTWFLGRKPG